MTDIELWIDQRERNVFPYFSNLDSKLTAPYTVELKTLSAGDYAVVYKNYIIMLIERKSWADLAATFIDNSRKFNYQKMMEERAKFGCRIFYLIEGKRPTTNIKHVQVDVLEAHLDHLLIDHDIVSLYSHDISHTPKRIFKLINSYISAHTNPFKLLKEKLQTNIPNTPVIPEISGDITSITLNFDDMIDISGDEKTQTFDNDEKTPSAIDSLCTSKKISDEAIHRGLWNSIEGITDINYLALKDINICILRLLCGEYQLSQLISAKYRSGILVGEKKLVKILKSANKPDIHMKVLSQIPGISKARASTILALFKLPDIIRGVITEQQLADITLPINKKSSITDIVIGAENLGGNRRLGNAVAKNIIKHLVVTKK